MDFDTLDKQIRGFERSLDRTMLQGIYIVARLDGHGFTRLTLSYIAGHLLNQVFQIVVCVLQGR